MKPNYSKVSVRVPSTIRGQLDALVKSGQFRLRDFIEKILQEVLDDPTTVEEALLAGRRSKRIVGVKLPELSVSLDTALLQRVHECCNQLRVNPSDILRGSLVKAFDKGSPRHTAGGGFLDPPVPISKLPSPIQLHESDLGALTAHERDDRTRILVDAGVLLLSCCRLRSLANRFEPFSKSCAGLLTLLGGNERAKLAVHAWHIDQFALMLAESGDVDDQVVVQRLEALLETGITVIHPIPTDYPAARKLPAKMPWISRVILAGMQRLWPTDTCAVAGATRFATQCLFGGYAAWLPRDVDRNPSESCRRAPKVHHLRALQSAPLSGR